jgi:alanine racemase
MRPEYKVWIELKKSAARNNIRIFRRLVGKGVQLWAVVKSNAYGHGLTHFSQLARECGVDGFCVDSVIEGAKLRAAGIDNPILVLGYTLPHLYAEAARKKITITLSSLSALQAFAAIRGVAPQFHLKIDTGMHRQGVYVEELPYAIKRLRALISSRPAARRSRINALAGIYTHFAAAKDPADTAYTDMQAARFDAACALLREAGFANVIRHAAATGGVLLGARYHYDAVRVGIGLYGIWPSPELEGARGTIIELQPVLSLHSIVSEVKSVPAGEGIGYDSTETAYEGMRLAIVPIGYWHGVPRAVSSVGRIHVGARGARIVGRVCMDILMADVTRVPCREGSEVVLRPAELARAAGASPYEVMTRINPLIYKTLV